MQWLAYRLQNLSLRIVNPRYQAKDPVTVCNHVEGNAFNMRFAPIDGETLVVKVCGMFDIPQGTTKAQIKERIAELGKLRQELAKLGTEEMAQLQNALNNIDARERKAALAP